MKPELLHIYGPISIQSYGALIALGVIISLALIYKDRRYKKLDPQNKLLDIITSIILGSFIGGRILFILTEDIQYDSIIEMFLPWTGGLSLLGGIIGALAILPVVLKRYNIPIVPFLDMIAIYAPLAQSFGRIGCFLAGCCHGSTAQYFPWAIIYTNEKCFAPQNIPLHPTQLYSAIGLLIIFLLMYSVIQYKAEKTGQLISIYLILSSLERFFVDFFRGDRILIFQTPLANISHTQLIAITITIFGSIILLITTRKKL